MKTSIYYINKLKDRLAEAQLKNPNYSLRAYARDLGIHPATLSLIIKGKRVFPLNSFDRVTEALALSEEEKSSFLESVSKIKFSAKKKMITTVIKVSLSVDQISEAEEIIAEFSKRIQNLGKPLPHEEGQSFTIKVTRH